jgi:hypothetical protein
VGVRRSAEQLSVMGSRAVFRVALLAALTVGCTHVAPYERGRLAHPMMTGDLEGPAAAHVYDVHEGAMGGGSPTAGGCGCN